MERKGWDQSCKLRSGKTEHTEFLSVQSLGVGVKTEGCGVIGSVLRSGPVWFFDFQIGQLQPQLV